MAVQLSDIFQMIDAGQRAKETRVNILDQLREQQAARALREQELQQQGSQFKDSMGMRDRELKMQEANASQMRELGLAHLLSQGAQPVAPRSHDMFGGLLQTVQPNMEDVTSPSNATIGGQQFFVPNQNDLLRERLGIQEEFKDKEMDDLLERAKTVFSDPADYQEFQASLMLGKNFTGQRESDMSMAVKYSMMASNPGIPKEARDLYLSASKKYWELAMTRARASYANPGANATALRSQAEQIVGSAIGLAEQEIPPDAPNRTDAVTKKAVENLSKVPKSAAKDMAQSMLHERSKNLAERPKGEGGLIDFFTNVQGMTAAPKGK